MITPAISVIIPCFNHGEFLLDAVASVTSIPRNDIELIVVDDGSVDERTRKQIDRLQAKGIHIIRQQNKGLASARNAGIRTSKAPYILPLDADNRIRPAYIEQGIQTLNANPKVGVVYGDAEYIGMRTGRWNVGPFNRDLLLRWNFIDACAVCRRSIWEQNRGYDGTMPVQGLEDWDFWLGAVEHGWEFAYVPEILFEYRVCENSMITHTFGFEPEIAKFVAAKHGPLYREAWLQLGKEYKSLQSTFQREHDSLKATSRNLHRLLKSRLKQELQRTGKQV